MTENINTREYWEGRFSSGDWENKRGRWQTRSFAAAQAAHFKIARSFAGSILDFGCGLGDAIPMYRKFFPKAELIGIDISRHAILKCKERYGHIATFLQGDHTTVPEVDVIIASNVMEHLSNDLEIAHDLLSRSIDLYITVPYRETPLLDEHVNVYDEYYYSRLGKYDFRIFACRGWSCYGWPLWYGIYFKMFLKSCSGKKYVVVKSR